jgi:hypothetical protein
MDLVIFLWALIATILFILEKRDHDTTRYEYLEYRTRTEITTVIDEQAISKTKPIRFLN